MILKIGEPSPIRTRPRRIEDGRCRHAPERKEAAIDFLAVNGTHTLCARPRVRMRETAPHRIVHGGMELASVLRIPGHERGHNTNLCQQVLRS
jgi:hypothetical protein